MTINELTKEQILAWLFDHEQALEDLCWFYDIDEVIDWDKVLGGDDDEGIKKD